MARAATNLDSNDNDLQPTLELEASTCRRPGRHQECATADPQNKGIGLQQSCTRCWATTHLPNDTGLEQTWGTITLKTWEKKTKNMDVDVCLLHNALHYAIFQALICLDNFMCCHTEGGSCRSNLLSHQVTVY